MKKPLTSKQYQLLIDIISHHSLFDKHDNCFQASRREIALKCGLKSKTTVDRLFTSLRSLGRIKDVKDIQQETRPMLDPRFYWKHSPLEKPFALAMFDLESYEKAVLWRRDCMLVGHYIHAQTGQLLKPYPYREMWEYRNSYLSTDRTKHRGKTRATERSATALLNCYEGEQEDLTFDLPNAA